MYLVLQRYDKVWPMETLLYHMLFKFYEVRFVDYITNILKVLTSDTLYHKKTCVLFPIRRPSSIRIGKKRRIFKALNDPRKKTNGIKRPKMSV